MIVVDTTGRSRAPSGAERGNAGSRVTKNKSQCVVMSSPYLYRDINLVYRRFF